jgi:hypothetical protein
MPSRIQPSKKLIERYANNFETISREDLAFTHTVFVQCFFPVRHPKKTGDIHQITHGNVSLLVRAGLLMDPNNRQKWEQREVPAGPKARLILSYINDRAIRTKSPVINMGSSMREFMNRNGISIGGRNGHELVREAKNIAAADIIIGTWEADTARQDKMTIAKSISFWIEKDCRQHTLWQPELELSSDYFQVLQDHRVPTVFPVLAALQDNPRAMDIYTWLCYRLPRVKSPTHIPYNHLHPIFGHGIQLRKHFKPEFLTALKQAQRYYTKAHITVTDKDYITLYPSPSPMPTRDRLIQPRALLPRR